ncbi:hypothetical protein L7F22_007800 [Adiantum nelumboides]|nr:hypothetical protein [Adiantum nelumboides]
MVSENGIEADPDKVKSIILLPSPKSTKQLATFIHKAKYMARFIPLSSQLLYPLEQMAKHDPLQWDDKCEEVFQMVKEVLGGLSAMQAPDWEQAFYVNPSVGDDAIGAMLLQKGKGSHYMRLVYCASRVKLVAERKLSKVELVMASVIFACQRFRHYLLPRPFVFLTSYAFLPQLINGTNMSNVVKKWVIELQEFEFSFLVEDSTRANLADLLTYKENPLLVKEEVVRRVDEEVPQISNAHVLFFDGSYKKSHDPPSGGIALYDPEGKLVCKRGFKLDMHSNNEAEYATLEAGLHICLKHGIRRLSIKGEGERAPECLKKDCFLAGLYPILREKVKVKFLDTFEKAMAYAREKDRKLKFQAQLQGGMEPPPSTQPIARTVAGTSVTDQESSQQELLQQITNQLESLSINLVQGVRAPQSGNDRNRQEGKRQTREKATGKAGGGLVLHDSNGEVVMKKHVKLPDSTSNNEAKYDILLHGLQVCVSQKIRRLMVKADALLIVKQILGIWACKNERLREKVQAIRRLFNQFEEVQLYHIPRKQNEVVDLLAQKAVACDESEVQVILAATAIKQPRYQGMESLAPIVSYILEGKFPQSFTKAQKQRLMEKASSYLFLEGALYQRGKDQVCRRIPTVEEIPSILEGFRKGLLTEVCEELHILHRHSTPYYPQSNGFVEKANGIIAGIIRKMVKNKTKLWDDFLDGALWAYRTTYKEATEFTPFHLVYGQEALQPIELNIQTMRLHGKAAQRKEEEWADRLLTLAELEWKREAAYECYKRKATQVKDKLDKEVKDKGIKEGDLVLRYDNRLDNRFDAKFETRWQGPYIVKKAFNSSYYQLMDLDGKEHPRKVNGYRLKPYLSQILPKDLQDQRQKSTLSHKSYSLVQLTMIDNMRAHLSARELLNKAPGCRGYAITPTSCRGVAPPIAKGFDVASGWPSVELQRHRTPRRKVSLFAYSESGKQLTRHEDDGSAQISSNENLFSTLTIEPNGTNTRRIVVAISIDAPLETLWSVLTDYEGLANFLPGLAVCKVEDRWETGARLFQIGEQNIAWGLKFSAKGVINVEERPIEVHSSSICRRIDFEMIEGDFQIFKGTWQMEQVSDEMESPLSEAVASSSQGTVLTYVVDVQPKVWLPVRLVEGILSKEIQNNLLCIRNQVLKSRSLLPAC